MLTLAACGRWTSSANVVVIPAARHFDRERSLIHDNRSRFGGANVLQSRATWRGLGRATRSKQSTVISAHSTGRRRPATGALPELRGRPELSYCWPHTPHTQSVSQTANRLHHLYPQPPGSTNQRRGRPLRRRPKSVPPKARRPSEPPSAKQRTWPLLARAPCSLKKLSKFKQPLSHFTWQVPVPLYFPAKM